MAILAISKLGNPILRQKALPVSPGEIKKAAFQQLIDDMFETMYAETGPPVARLSGLKMASTALPLGVNHDGSSPSESARSLT
jgi:peptide deformylase